MTSQEAVRAANALLDAGRLEEAESAWQAIVAANPTDFDAVHLLAYVIARRGRTAESLALLDRAVAGAPQRPAIRLSRAFALNSLGRLADAASDFEAVVAAEPRNVVALDNLGLVQKGLGRRAAAEDCHRRALAVDPRYVPALNNLGNLLREQDRVAESLDCIHRALEAEPGNGVALNNLGRLLHREGRLGDALDHYAKAAAALPRTAAVRVNWANALLDDGDLAAARERYDEALRISPTMADALYGRAHVDLREGRFKEGWDGYEARFDTSWLAGVRKPPPLPRLDRTNLGDARRVAVWAEQGLGDQLLYATLLPELARPGLTAVVEVDPRLAGAYRRAFPGMEFVPRDDWRAFETCDHQIPIASLARLFRPTRESFEAQPKALLQADPERAREMREKLGPGRWIAVAWRSPQGGHPGSRRWLAERKSMPMDLLAPLTDVPGVRLLDLQFGDVDTERRGFDARHPGRIARLPGLDTTNDLEGVLAALQACERVVTTSNSVAHLAGASGRPTWLVHRESHAPFHYWVPGPDGRSLWYPSVEVVSDAGWRWEDAVDAVRTRLEAGA